MKLIIKGTKYEVKWFQKILSQHKKIRVDSHGKLYPARDGSGNVLNGIYRQDFGISKANIDKEE